ncbi:MAG: hypothetical protein AB8B55_15525 [Mariniblastus sp.]
MPESQDFDPYLKWLGIRDSARPVNHYRLLGLDLFESDHEVISMAADRQMAHIRTYQSGPNGDASQVILGELARARRCLLMPEKKAVYDQQLSASLNSGSSSRQIVQARPVRPPSAPTFPPSPAAPEKIPTSQRGIFPPEEAIPVVRATHPPANFSPRHGVQPPPIPSLVPTSNPAAAQAFVAPVPAVGVRADGNARKKIRKRERKQLIWMLGSWIAGGVAAVGMAAYLVTSGVVPNPWADVEPDEVVQVKVVGETEGAGQANRDVARKNKVDSKLKNRTSDPANKVVWDEAKIRSYERPGSVTLDLLAKIDEGIKFGKTVRFKPSQINAGESEVLFVAKPGRLVIGFAYSTDSKGKIRALQPILLSGKKAYVAGKIGGSQIKYVVAQPGYAVGAMKVSSLDPMNCFRITFMKIQSNGLEPNDSYLSELHGDNRGPLTDVKNERGLPIVGVYTRIVKGVRIATLGMVGVDFSVAQGYDSLLVNRDRYKPKKDVKDFGFGGVPDSKQPAGPADPARPRRGMGDGRDAADPPSQRKNRDAVKPEAGRSRARRPEWFGDSAAAEPDDEPIERLPIPEKREREKAAKAMESAYAPLVKRAFDSKRVFYVQRLAKQMVDDSQSEQLRDASRYALLERALLMVKSVGDAETAIEIVREMSDVYQIEFWGLAFSVLKESATNIDTVYFEKIELQKSYRKTMSGLINEAIEKRVFIEARRFAVYAAKLGTRSGDRDLKSYKMLQKAIDEMQEVSDAAKGLAKALRENSKHPEANQAFGNYMFVIEDDLAEAIEYWQNSDAKPLVEVAKGELGINDMDGAELTKLGDQWRALGKSNRNIFQNRSLKRAVEVYDEAIGELDRREADRVRLLKQTIEKMLLQ